MQRRNKQLKTIKRRKVLRSENELESVHGQRFSLHLQFTNTTKILSQGTRPPGFGFGPFRAPSKMPNLRPLSTPKEHHLRIPPQFRFCLHHRLSNTCVRNIPSVVRWTCPVNITVINVFDLLGCVKSGDETIKTTKYRQLVGETVQEGTFYSCR
jgi:hypothetical protein